MENFNSDLTDQIGKMSQTEWIIFGLAVICYIPLIIAVITSRDPDGKKNGAGQNFYTFILWLILDIIQLICTILANGTYVQFLAFAPCAAIVTILLIKHRKKINDFEIFISIFIFICVVIWLTVGSKQAIIFETICQVVAGFPLLKDTWAAPEKFTKTLLPLFGFMVMYILILCTIPNFSIEHALFPGALLVYTFISFVFITRGLKLKSI